MILQDGKGKGMALRTAFTKIEEDVCVILDGDATYDPLEMEEIINYPGRRSGHGGRFQAEGYNGGRSDYMVE
ncbi:MAG: hypothetical protein QG670_2098 [Thermoproteota archaeon]|nr:hypothetical protein [Thermoproteota archaeon]